MIQPRKPAKTAKAAKHNKETTKITTRKAKPANLGSQRWSSQATRPSSFLSQARKPTKTAKAAKHNKKTTKITTRTAKPANLDLQGCGPARLLRNTWMPTYLCSLLSQTRKPAKTAKAAKHNKKTAKITGRTAKPANLGLQGCGPTRCSLEALQGSLKLPRCLTFSKAL